MKVLVDCTTYSGQVPHARARIHTHKSMLWCEELSVYCAKLSVDWHRLPQMSCIMLGSSEINLNAKKNFYKKHGRRNIFSLCIYICCELDAFALGIYQIIKQVIPQILVHTVKAKRIIGHSENVIICATNF